MVVVVNIIPIKRSTLPVRVRPESDANITTAPFRFQVAHRVDQKALPDDDFDNYHDWLSWCCLYDWVLPLLRAVWVLQTLDLALWVHLKPDHDHDCNEDDDYYNKTWCEFAHWSLHYPLLARGHEFQHPLVSDGDDDYDDYYDEDDDDDDEDDDDD